MIVKNLLVALMLLSVALMSGCGDDKAEQSFSEHLDRAKVYQEQGQYKAATIEYRNAVKKSQGKTDSVAQYAEMLVKLGQYQSALALLDQVKSDKDSSYYEVRVKALQGMQKFQSAQKILEDNLSGNDTRVELLRAHNLLGLNELEEARKAYQAILTKDAKDSMAKLGKATALVRLNKVNESKSVLNSIEQGAEAYNRARLLLAGIAIAEQDLEAAEDILTNVLSVMKNTDVIEPDKAIVLERLSYVLTRQGRSNEAYIYTKLLAEAFPGANEVREQYQLAVEKLKAGERAEAKKTLLDLLNNYPSYKQATQLLGIISYLEGDNIEASKYLSESVDPEVANDMTRHIYAATNLKLNDPKKVLEILGPGIAESKVPETLVLYGLAAISDGQVKKGEESLLKALSLDEDNLRIRLVLADFYRAGASANKAKEWEQLDAAYEIDSTDIQVLKNVVSFHLRHNGPKMAKQFVSKILGSHPKDYATNLIAGYFYVNQGDVKTALNNFTVAAETEKEGDNYLNALFAKGRAEITLRKIDESLSTFSAIIQSFPESILGYRGLLSVYSVDGNISKGIDVLERYARTDSRFSAYVVLIQEAITQQNVSKARVYFDEVKEAFPEDERIGKLGDRLKYTEAMIAALAKDFVTARQKIAEVLTGQPDNMRLLSFMVDLELRAGRINEAEKVLEQIEVIDQNHQIVTRLHAEVALAKEDYRSAAQYLEKSWNHLPDDATGIKLYRTLNVLGEKVAQNEFLKSWLLKLPSSSQANMYQAVVYQQSGDRQKAAGGYEKVIAASPNNVVALNNLGWIYYEQKDFRALDLLKKAAELAPDNAAVLDSYGWVLVENGQVNKGIPYLEKAHELSPETKEIEEHLNQAKARR